VTTMTDIRTQLKDPRRRNLAILAGVAIVTVVLAVLGLAHQASLTARHENPELFFPGLDTRIRDVAQIRIRSKKGAVDVVFKPARSWVVASQDDYPASHEQVHQTLVALATLTTLERKTARADWFPYVDLVAPEQGGNGTEITLYDEHGATIASVITGKSVDIGDPDGAVGLFVRRPGETQSWLARSFFEPKSAPGDWLDKDVMSIDRARIQETDVDPISGPFYVVRRDKASDADFKLTEVPKGRELAYDGAPDTVAAAVADFSFDDVKPARYLDFSDPAHTARLISKTFDGLIVSVNVIQVGQNYWATISAEGTTSDARNEAREIDARASGWAYKLPASKGQQFMTPLESLLKPKGATAASTGAPPAAQ
jgi:hypothetical protein